jgi:protein-L-isoaspartate(D-aspartate) O-methyltransferase
VAHMNSNGWPNVTVDDPYAELRRAMVDTQIRRRGITDERVLAAMASVPRHEFVPPQNRNKAYEDEPLPIGGGQTISQPYIVAAMTAALRLEGRERVLEIGTGCGYQAAVLSVLADSVFSVEWRPELARAAEEHLKRLGFGKLQVRSGDGSEGLPEFAPYDAILVAAAAPSLPKPLLEQLNEGGRMIAPVGTEEHQHLLLVTRRGGAYTTEKRDSCRFVPLLGQHGWRTWELL